QAGRELDALVGGRLARAAADDGFVYADGEVAAARLGAFRIGAVDPLDPDLLRAGAAAALRARPGGGTVVWAFDPSLPLAAEEHLRALVEGAVLGGYRPDRWKTGERRPAVERFVIAGTPEGLADVAARAALVARWTNVARDLVDGPP